MMQVELPCYDDDLAGRERRTLQEGFARAVYELAERDPRVVALAVDCTRVFFLTEFRRDFPDRFFNVGIAEQDLIGIGAGLAAAGCIPYCVGFGPFVSMRACEQIRTDCGYTNFNVKIGTQYAGLTQPVGGSTHHGMEDIAIVRTMANLTVLCPADYREAYGLALAAAAHPGPVYIRMNGKNPDPLLYGEDYKPVIGQAVTLTEGNDLTIVACGGMVQFALRAARLLAREGVGARVINLHTVKPIDRAALVQAARETGRVLTVEEHTIYGGMGSAVAEVLAQEYPVPMLIHGVADLYASVGPLDPLRAKYGLSAESIAARARELLRR